MRLAKAGVAAALALMAPLSTAMNLALSMRRGPLAMPPLYDDVTYLLDAIDRLSFGGVRSLGSLAASFIDQPPHAPLSTLTAMLGFSLFGTDPWAAYAANIWLVLAFVTIVYKVTRTWLGQVPSLLVAAASLFVPVGHALVTEFRPDMAAGMLLAFALYKVLTADLLLGRKRGLVLTGLLCAVSIMAKPSAFVITMPVVALAGLVAIVRHRQAWRSALSGAVVVAAAAAIPLVLFILNWGKKTVEYVYAAMVTHKHVWDVPGTWTDHLLLYSAGFMGTYALGSILYVGLIVIAADVFVMAFARQRDFLRLSFYGLTAFIYAGLAFTASKSVFQGSFFFFPFILSTVMALSALAARWRLEIMLPAACLLLAAILLPPATLYRETTERDLSAVEIADIFTKRIIDAAAACPNQALRVTSLAPSPLPPETIAFYAARHLVRLEPSAAYFRPDLEQTIDMVDASDFVMTPNVAEQNKNQGGPRNAFIPEVVDYLEKSGDWDILKPDIAGSPTLYLRKRCRSEPRPST